MNLARRNFLKSGALWLAAPPMLLLPRKSRAQPLTLNDPALLAIPVTGIDPVVLNYRDVVLPAIGSPALPNSTILTLSGLVQGCRGDAIWAKMIELNAYPSADNLNTSTAPLIVGPSGGGTGAYRWALGGAGFSDAQVTINGCALNGTDQYMRTGIRPNGTFPSANNAGFSIYVSTITASGYDFGGYNITGTQPFLAMAANQAGNFRGHCWDNVGVAPELLSAAPNLAGFYSCSRTSATDFRSYFANSGNAFAQQAASLTASTDTWFTDQQIAVFGILFDSALFVPTARRQAFFAVHEGLTAAETQKLYNRVQAYRVALGGGFA